MEATIQFNYNQFTPITANATSIRGNSTKNIYTSNNNNMTTGKKVEEFDGSKQFTETTHSMSSERH